MRADLHIHSTASDSRWPPQRVAAGCAAESIGLFAITDHDTIGGVEAAERCAREHGLAFLRAVEISAQLGDRLFHILGYGIDLQILSADGILQRHHAAAEAHDEAVVEALIAEAHPLNLDDFASYEYDRQRGGWRTLNFALDRGIATDMADFFGRVMRGIDVEPAAYATAAEVITIIRDADGVPILAHPGGSLHQVGVSDDTLDPFLELGIAGLECYSQYHDGATTRRCLDWCRKHDLLVTGGSDYHGGFVGRRLGIPWVDVSDLALGEIADRIVR